ncbi:hypothetical protein HNQ96_005662 [Aminobacter lissarensis]|uniref:Uncharacterized protein n=1 Tax=Aminobacter carboxidus TaxID=376165 RepID=A0A8E1WKP4_9HYPH|nr:hypothetical protein [Aminobacter lissarensis]MBB6469768.1 hypothetical protein [Aminobacter lissarensis]
MRHGHVGFAVVAERNVQAFEACEFFEIAETDARQMIRETAQRISV